MTNKFHIVLCLLVFSTFGGSVLADTPVVPWSKVISSSNKKFKLVLLSPKSEEQVDYVTRLREFWRKGGIPSEWIPEEEKKLQKEIDQEREIRNKFPESGLYVSSDVPQLLWKIDLYDIDSWYLVANDGDHLVVVKDEILGIKEEKSIEGNPHVKEIVKSVPDMSQVVLSFYSLGSPIRSYKATELTEENGLSRTVSYDFRWNDTRVLNEEEMTVLITKKDGQSVLFDYRTGDLIAGELKNQPKGRFDKKDDNQLENGEKNRQVCGSIALALAVLVSLVFRT